MKVKRFNFRIGSRLDPKKAAVVGQRLERLRKRYEVVTPKAVVEDARSASSPLHSFFEWNNGKAAEKYRLEQARHLIRSVVVTYETPPGHKKIKPIRAYVTIKDEDNNQPYRPIHEVLSDAAMHEQLMARALAEANSWHKRYKDLAEFAEVFAALTKVNRKHGRKKGKKRSRRPVAA